MATFVRVSSSTNNKAYQYVGGSSNVGMFYSGNLSGSGVNGAARFDDITIDKNTMIGEAKIYGQYNQQGYNWYRTTIYGIDAGDITTFNNINPFTQTKTPTGSFNQKQLQNKGFSEAGWMDLSVTGQVQAIVNRSDWVSGHAMGFILENDNSDNGCCIWGPYGYIEDENGNQVFVDNCSFILAISYFDITTTSTTTSTSTSTTTTSTSTTTLLEDFGIKISKPGFDAKDATENELVFSSKYAMLKTAVQGSQTGTSLTIPHNLGYTPTFKVYATYGGNCYQVPRINFAGGFRANAYTDNTNLYISGLNAAYYYYIYYDSI